MPGVITRTDVVTGDSGVAVPPSATYFVAGLTERGPVDELGTVRSLADYVRQYGERTSYGRLYDDLRTFFAEGGAIARVVRVVGPAAVKALLTLADRAGSPLSTARITAKEPGAYGNGITVQVAGASGAVVLTVTDTASGAVEVFGPAATVGDLVTAVNAGSVLVTATNLGSATAAPNNAPAVLAATHLATGADDRASVTAAGYVAALDTLAPIDEGVGAVAVPGQAASGVGALLLTHADATRRIALLAPALGDLDADNVDDAGDLIGELGHLGGLFSPWVTIPDGADTLTIPPEGYVAGVRARAHATTGPWRAYAGDIARARFVNGVERTIDRDAGDALDAAQVNAIRVIAGDVRVYGARSLTDDLGNHRHLLGAEVTNVVEASADAAAEPFTFLPIDSKGQLLSRLEGALVGIVAPMAAAGGLSPREVNGERMDPGYRVDLSANTPATLAANEVHATLGVRPPGAAELIIITIVKAAASTPL